MIKIEEYEKKLLDGVKQVLESGSFKDFIAFTSKFWHYSIGNNLLIWSQYPDATYVAGIKTWNSLGRKVKKGAKGIKIAVPLKRKRRTEDEGNATEEERDVLCGFRFRSIFDVTQTEGEPLPELDRLGAVKEICADSGQLFERLLAASPVPVTLEVLDKGKNGTYFIMDNRIAVSSSLEAPGRCKTLLHELAHHFALSTELKDTFDIQGRSSHEVVAEGAAYMACSHFGIDSSDYSFTYLAVWGNDYKKIWTLCKAIKSVATRLVELVINAEDEAA